MTPNLDKALFAAQGDLDSIPRDEQHPEGYAYVGTDAMIIACRGVLRKHGVFVRRAKQLIADGGTKVVSTFEVTHKDSGEKIISEFEFAVFFEPGRANDKAVAGAATTAWREWFRDLLCLPRRHPNEMDERRGAAPTQQPAAVHQLPSRQVPELFDRLRPEHMRAAEQHFVSHHIATERWRERLFKQMQGKPLDHLAGIVRADREDWDRKRGAPPPRRRH